MNAKWIGVVVEGLAPAGKKGDSTPVGILRISRSQERARDPGYPINTRLFANSYTPKR